MLTRLQIKGFKNLLDVDLWFGPFTCLAGPNAVGKSNVFDAIRFLNLLVHMTIPEAVQQLRETRGRSPDAASLFTSSEDFRASELELVADMILERDVEDDFGVKSKAAISTVRYEVAFRLVEGRDERLELAREELKPIRQSDALRGIRFPASAEFRKSVVQGRRTVDLISTDGQGASAKIRLHQEGHGGRILPAPKSSRTVLGGTTSADFPTVLAVHREMESWQTLLLESTAMRAPSLYVDPKKIDPRGANMASTLARLERARGRSVYSEVANRLSELIDDVRSIDIRDDEKTETLTLMVTGSDGIPRAARSLSDGTLRFLALAILAVDPESRGVLCIEEPENGIHPERIGAIVRLLKDIALDPQHRVAEDNPLRQVIANTHSPTVFQNIDPNDVVYLEPVEAQGGRVVATRVPAKTWRAKYVQPSGTVAPGRLQPYLRRVSGQLAWDSFLTVSDTPRSR